MKFLRRTTWLIALMMGWSASAMSEDTLTFAIEGYYPPFSQIADDGSFEGFDIEIGQALCQALERECEFVQADWDRLISGEGLQDGSYDAIIASMSILPSRRQKFAFTQKYYTTPARFIGASATLPEIEFLDGRWRGLDGLRIGVQQSTTEDDFLRDNPITAANIERFKTLPQAFDELGEGNLDLVFADGLALHSGFLTRPEGEGFEMVGPSFDHPRWFGEGIGIAVSRTNWELVNELNRAIQLIRADGTYDRIAGEYFDFDIYGSD